MLTIWQCFNSQTPFKGKSFALRGGEVSGWVPVFTEGGVGHHDDGFCSLPPQALDGFVMVFAADGRVLYTSETIAQYLGLRQV